MRITKNQNQKYWGNWKLFWTFIASEILFYVSSRYARLYVSQSFAVNKFSRENDRGWNGKIETLITEKYSVQHDRILLVDEEEATKRHRKRWNKFPGRSNKVIKIFSLVCCYTLYVIIKHNWNTCNVSQWSISSSIMASSWKVEKNLTRLCSLFIQYYFYMLNNSHEFFPFSSSAASPFWEFQISVVREMSTMLTSSWSNWNYSSTS